MNLDLIAQMCKKYEYDLRAVCAGTDMAVLESLFRSSGLAIPEPLRMVASKVDLLREVPFGEYTGDTNGEGDPDIVIWEGMDKCVEMRNLMIGLSFEEILFSVSDAKVEGIDLGREWIVNQIRSSWLPFTSTSPFDYFCSCDPASPAFGIIYRMSNDFGDIRYFSESFGRLWGLLEITGQ